MTRATSFRENLEVTVLIVCHLSSLLILDCMSSIMPSKGEASLLGDDSEDELLPYLKKNGIALEHEKTTIYIHVVIEEK